jgi:hypothetical protein
MVCVFHSRAAEVRERIDQVRAPMQGRTGFDEIVGHGNSDFTKSFDQI